MADICIIYNPASGRGRGKSRLNRLRRVLKNRGDFRPTREPGDGVELARQAAHQGFRVVAAAGGDGTVHEVANGLLQAGSKGSILAVIPIGSANDYAHSLDLPPDWWRWPDASIGLRQVDVGLVRATEGRERFFINGLGLGFNCAVTLEARRIKSLRGIPLYLLALIRAMWRRYHSPLLAMNLDEQQRSVPTLSLTVSLGRREGNFVLTPDAVLDDGWFDYLHVGPLPRFQLLRYVPRMITGRIPRNDPMIVSGRCRRVVLESQTPLIVHTDGEFFCRPEDAVYQLEIELLVQKLPVLGKLPLTGDRVSSEG